MTASTGWSLQRAVYQALASSPALTAQLGGARIYDVPPQDASYPFISLGENELHDWSTGSDDGSEHLLTLHVWSRGTGRKQAHDILEAVKDVMHDKPLSLSDHHLVNLRQEFSEVRPDVDEHTYHGIVRYRAVTEPAQAEAA